MVWVSVSDMEVRLCGIGLACADPAMACGVHGWMTITPLFLPLSPVVRETGEARWEALPCCQNSREDAVLNKPQ
jgi:hypothetical protein